MAIASLLRCTVGVAVVVSALFVLNQESAFLLNYSTDTLFPITGFNESSINSRERKLTSLQKNVTLSAPNIIGTFNGLPISLQSSPAIGLQSHVHCVGENYRFDAWKHRSCRFSNLCLNLTSRKFVVFSSIRERHLWKSQLDQKHDYIHLSSILMRGRGGQVRHKEGEPDNLSPTVSIGGINTKWGPGSKRLEWFPEILPGEHWKNLAYYALPEDTVLIPYHSLNARNPGHLVWDEFLPMYNLLEMFQLDDFNHSVLPLRYVLQDGIPALWATCDYDPQMLIECKALMKKFAPLIMRQSSATTVTSQLLSTVDYELNLFLEKDQTSHVDLVCAKTGVAGMGALTDHGMYKRHGWEERDYLVSHNDGRGGLLYRFRNFMVQTLGLAPTSPNGAGDVVPHKAPRRIVFSQLSSDHNYRNLDFSHLVDIVKRELPGESVEPFVFKKLSIHDQVEVARTTAIYVTICGGGAVTAMFLPKGASLIVYYQEDAGADGNRLTGKPALLDWDLLNSMSHLRVHWLPRNTMTQKGEHDEKALVALMKHELELIESGMFVR